MNRDKPFQWGDKRTVYYVQWMAEGLMAYAPYYETEHEARFGAQIKEAEGRIVNILKVVEEYKGGRTWLAVSEELIK